MSEWCEDENQLGPDERRWPMAPTDLLPRERWRWWEQLWSDVRRARRPLPDAASQRMVGGRVQVEALAALAAWVERYDSGEWDDPPGKLSLLYDVERVRELIRGNEPFHPGRDRVAFSRFLIDAGCQPPPGTDGPAKRRADQR